MAIGCLSACAPRELNPPIRRVPRCTKSAIHLVQLTREHIAEREESAISTFDHASILHRIIKLAHYLLPAVIDAIRCSLV